MIWVVVTVPPSLTTRSGPGRPRGRRWAPPHPAHPPTWDPRMFSGPPKCLRLVDRLHVVHAHDDIYLPFHLAIFASMKIDRR